MFGFAANHCILNGELRQYKREKKKKDFNWIHETKLILKERKKERRQLIQLEQGERRPGPDFG